jgi:deoxyribodipyrimidine photo-lyase
MGVARMPDLIFEGTPQAAEHRLAAVRPHDYARTRNQLDGAVTHLSPYLTHGFLTVPEVLATLRHKHSLPLAHKLRAELGWREFFHHAWRHDGEDIFQSLHPGPLPDSAYSRTLPQDIRQAATGVPVIDAAVRALYATGHVHNHARMWLASYVVHVRKVHWRAGADWLYAHLLDGDLASNHLSWQWVTGTGSHKPYLFNAENVARYAPLATHRHWHSPDTVIDTSYEALDEIARSALVKAASITDADASGIDEPALLTQPPAEWGFAQPNAQAVHGRSVWLLHPWSLATPPDGVLPVAVLDARFHQRWPWSQRRWQFVGQRLAALTHLRWWAEAPQLLQALRSARSVQGVHNLHLAPEFSALGLQPMPRAFVDPTRRCQSFSAFWSQQSDAQPAQGVLFT